MISIWFINPYRYCFNGKEKDDEVKGTGNSLDFGARIYDPRIGRWLSVDALASKYPDLSPYNFVANNPIIFIDPDGNEIVDPKGRVAVIMKEDGGFEFTEHATPSIKKVVSAMIKTNVGREIVTNMIKTDYQIKINLLQKKVTTKSLDGKTLIVTGLTIPQRDEDGNFKGFNIEIYKGSIKELRNSSNKQSEYSEEDHVGSTGVHEGTHATDEKSNQIKNPKSTREEREAKPVENTKKHKKELDEQKKDEKASDKKK